MPDLKWTRLEGDNYHIPGDFYYRSGLYVLCRVHYANGGWGWGVYLKDAAEDQDHCGRLIEGYRLLSVAKAAAKYHANHAHAQEAHP